MRLFCFLFLFSSSLFAQKPPIEVKTIAVNSFEIKQNKRKFVIDYQITNLQNQEVKFFLYPKSLIAFPASSLTLFPVYKIYKNGIYEDMDGPFYEQYFEEQNDIELIQNEKEHKQKVDALIKRLYEERNKIIQEYKKNGGTNTDENWVYSNQKLLQSIIILKPNETKNFQIITLWDKKRYFKIDDNEYYIDENEKYEIEFSLHLDKSNRKEKLSEEEYNTIKNDTAFIEGEFTSSKMPINFRE